MQIFVKVRKSWKYEADILIRVTLKHNVNILKS